MKKTFILLIVITLPLISFSQNRQNKYYNPLRFSLSGITKVVLESDENHTDKYSFDQGIGLIGELIYTIDERAKYEISLEAGFLSTFSYSDEVNTDKYLIPVALNAH